MQGFISYAHNDYDDYIVLKRDLKSIEHGMGICFWCDSRLKGGYSWHEAILEQIRLSKVFLLLVSPDYFASSYIIEHELKAISTCQRIDDALVIPIILRDCAWAELLGKPQALPIGDQGRVVPIYKWKDTQDGFNAARAQVAAAIAHKFNLKSVPLLDPNLQLVGQTERGFVEIRKELRVLEVVAKQVAAGTGINTPEIQERLKSLAGLAERFAKAASTAPESDLLGQLLSFELLIEQSGLADIDVDTEQPIAERLRAREGLGNIKLCIDRSIKAARRAGFGGNYESTQSAANLAIGAETIRSLTSQLNQIEGRVEELRKAAPQTISEDDLPSKLVKNFSDRVSIKIDLARLELENESRVNVSALTHLIEEITRLSAAFAKTVVRMIGWLGESVVHIAKALQGSTSAALSIVHNLANRSPSNQVPPSVIRQGETFRDLSATPEMVVVPAGSFLMGSPNNEDGHSKSEEPLHPVTIPRAFAVAIYAVTFEEWEAAQSDEIWTPITGLSPVTPSDRGWGRGRRPVISISWDLAKAYILWLSKKTGQAYRLLSEAEWEYIARAGTSTPYWWGASISKELANYDGLGTLPVDAFQPNPFGLYQVHGNTWEWVEDVWHDDYFDAPTDGSARASAAVRKHIRRGGSWDSDPPDLRAAYRHPQGTDSRFSKSGFRVARAL